MRLRIALVVLAGAFSLATALAAVTTVKQVNTEHSWLSHPTAPAHLKVHLPA